MKTARAKRPVRGSLMDLVLVVGVLMAVWSRTPLGNLGTQAFAWATGLDVSTAPLVSTLNTHSADIDRLVARVNTSLNANSLNTENGALPSQWESQDGSFPEPFRSAAKAALVETPVPEPYRGLVDDSQPLPDQHLVVLDSLYQEGEDARVTLQRYALGPAGTERAMERARSAGEATPERWDTLRRYLSAKEQQLGDRLVSTTLGTAAMLTLQWPVLDGARISSPYGYRHHPVLSKRKFHNGVDLSVPVGTPVWAAQKGKVTVAGNDAVNGNYVVIDHSNGVRTSYCHLDSLEVEKKEQVQRGQAIGQSGNTGRSTGPHLHFVVRVGGKAVDPEHFRADTELASADPVPAME
ncbi:MAG: murein DD-endopeptidase [Cognaticolwellia sp.]